MAETYEAVGDLDAAGRAFELALRMDKERRLEYPHLFFSFGLLLSRLGQPEAARGQFAEYLRLVPEDELIQRLMNKRLSR